MRTVLLVRFGGAKPNALKTASAIDPWSAGSDPWAHFAKTAIAKKAKKEELGEDLADGFGLGPTYATNSSSAASSAPGMALSAEAAAIIAAVNQNTDQKISPVTGRLDMHEGLVVDLGARAVAFGWDKALTSAAASVSSGAAASTAAGASTVRFSTNPYSHSGAAGPDPNGVAAEYCKPPKKRRVIRLGGFPANTSAELITPVLDAIRLEHPGIVGAYPSGQITNKALIVFASNGQAWDLMKKMKGRKFEFQDGAGGVIRLWHNFDKSPAEQLISIRTSALVGKIKEHLIISGKATQDSVSEFIGGDWDIGHSWLINRLDVPDGAPAGTLGRPQNWPLARVQRGTEATFSRLPGVERIPSFTIDLVDQWIADINTLEHGGATTMAVDA